MLFSERKKGAHTDLFTWLKPSVKVLCLFCASKRTVDSRAYLCSLQIAPEDALLNSLVLIFCVVLRNQVWLKSSRLRLTLCQIWKALWSMFSMKHLFLWHLSLILDFSLQSHTLVKILITRTAQLLASVWYKCNHLDLQERLGEMRCFVKHMRLIWKVERNGKKNKQMQCKQWTVLCTCWWQLAISLIEVRRHLKSFFLLWFSSLLRNVDLPCCRHILATGIEADMQECQLESDWFKLAFPQENSPVRTNQGSQVNVSCMTCLELTGSRGEWGAALYCVLASWGRGPCASSVLQPAVLSVSTGALNVVCSRTRGSLQQVCQEKHTTKGVLHLNCEIWQALAKTTSTSLHLHLSAPPMWIYRAVRQRKIYQSQKKSISQWSKYLRQPKRLQKQRLEKI